MNRSFNIFRDRFELIDQQNQLLKQQKNQTRHNLIERYRIRNNYYRRKFPHILKETHSGLSDYQSLEKTTKIQYQCNEVYKYLINRSTLRNIDYYNDQLERTNTFLHCLKTDVNQCENEVNQLKFEVTDKINQIDSFAKNLFDIQCEQELIRSNIKQLKDAIRFENDLYHRDTSSCFLVPPTTKSLREIELEEELENLKEFHHDQRKSFDEESTKLVEQIKEMQTKIDQRSNEVSTLKDQIKSYQTSSKPTKERRKLKTEKKSF